MDLARKRVKRIAPTQQKAAPSCIDDLRPLAVKKADSILEAEVKNGEIKDAAIVWNRAYHLTMNSLCRKFGFR